MIKVFKSSRIVVVLAVLITACGSPVVHAQSEAQTAPGAATYQAILGKSLTDQDVVDFMTRNHCFRTGQLRACYGAGMALWIGRNQKVEAVYLYLAKTDVFGIYEGMLPDGLVSQDTMATVEQKFGQRKIEHAPQAGWEPGLPDEGRTPDHIHYWAKYERFGLTVIYNSPSAEHKGATMYALVVSK